MRVIAFLFLAVTVLVSTCFAQDGPIQLETSPPPPAPVSELVKSVGSAAVKYIPVRDETRSEAGGIALSTGDGGWGSISAAFKYSGKAFRKPTDITLNFFITAKDRAYVDNRRLIIIADETMLLDTEAELKDGRTNGREVYASLTAALSLADFNKLANSGKALFQLGQSKWLIPVDRLSGFRDLLKIIEEGK